VVVIDLRMYRLNELVNVLLINSGLYIARFRLGSCVVATKMHSGVLQILTWLLVRSAVMNVGPQIP
jgi:uncharacterized circularly permuted ATP-grasp superfamily protein